ELELYSQNDPPPKQLAESKEISCCVVGCFNTSSKNKSLEFFPFPPCGPRYNAWLSLIRRSDPESQLWNPEPESRICAVHFYKKGVNVFHSSGEDIQDHSYAPVFFPHNLCEDAEMPSSVSPDEHYDDKMTLSYPSWMDEISDFILDCQEERKFTDVIISNGSRSFEAHRIILMSALPMLKKALLDLEYSDEMDKTLILIP
ncbi:Uncharacterized protein FKW44_016080, partial [Caligus rogercresseyi]